MEILKELYIEAKRAPIRFPNLEKSPYLRANYKKKLLGRTKEERDKKKAEIKAARQAFEERWKMKQMGLEDISKSESIVKDKKDEEELESRKNLSELKLNKLKHSAEKSKLTKARSVDTITEIEGIHAEERIQKMLGLAKSVNLPTAKYPTTKNRRATKLIKLFKIMKLDLIINTSCANQFK